MQIQEFNNKTTKTSCFDIKWLKELRSNTCSNVTAIIRKRLSDYNPFLFSKQGLMNISLAGVFE